ncbi:MAG: bifunctional riboflavin kinase/FAD synthetase [Gemmataceae bacterium]
MAVFPLSLDASASRLACRGGVVSIGNFDGVHRGHQALLGETMRQAKARGVPAVAVTFDPHPLEILRPESFQPLLTTLPYRAELIQALGVDHVVLLRTSSEFLRLSADDFFRRVIVEGLGAAALVEGWNFRFGRGRQGDGETLTRRGREAGIDVTLFPAHTVRDRLVSSSVVREDLLAGDVADAALLLGRPYRLEGKVVREQQRGRTLGFPTANLRDVKTLIPGDGVYAVLAHHGGKPWPGAANIGPNPTFGEQGHKLEVHLIGFQGNLYGHSLAVDFLEKIRNTRPFGNVRDLVAQIRDDVGKAHAVAGGALADGARRAPAT